MPAASLAAPGIPRDAPAAKVENGKPAAAPTPTPKGPALERTPPSTRAAEMFARESFPADPEERRNLARMHFARGVSAHRLAQLSRAANEYQRTLWLDPARVDAWNNLGVALRDRGRFGSAVVALQRALELQPSFARAHHNMGEIAFLTGNLAGAVQEYEEALRLEPASLETRLNLAVVYRQQQRYQEAEKTLRGVLEANPNLPEAHYNLARVYELSGKRERAIEAYENFLRLRGTRFDTLAERVRRHLATLKKPAG